MNRYITIFIIALLFICTAVSAQQNALDSIAAIAENTQDLKQKSTLYANLASDYNSTDVNKSIRYAHKAIDAARKGQHKKEKCRAYIMLTTSYLRSGYIDSAAISSKKCLALAEKLQNHYYLYFAERNLARVYIRQANFDSSLVHFHRHLKIAEEHLNDTLVGDALNSLGGYYATIQDLDKAEEFHKKALEIRIKAKDSLGMAYSYDNLGIVNRDLGNYRLSLYYYNKALAIHIVDGDSSDIAFMYNDLGAAYSKLGITDTGELYLKRSISMREQMNELNELAYTYNYLGENYERKGELKKAERWIKKALNLAIEIKNNKQNYEAYESLSDFFARNKMYDSAYKYLQLYKSFRDSIRRLDNEQLIAELNTKYETEKKEKKIQEQEFQLSKKNYWITGISILLVLGTLLGYSYYRRYKLKQQAAIQDAVMKQQELATKAVIEAEENERQRIAGDLHDGVGQMMSAARINLSAVTQELEFKDEQLKDRFNNALKLVDDSCTEVRTVSHNIMPNALLKNSLAAAVRSFLNKIDEKVLKIDLYTEGLNEKIDENTETVLYRIVQECVNNVIKHANANKLDISLIKDEGEISVTIEDNGNGFDTSKMDKVEGVGLKNIKSRVSYLKGNIEWDSAIGRGTVVSIHIPV